MGFQATVVIHLDAIHEIEHDPEFGKKLAQAILEKANHDPLSDRTVRFNAAAGRASSSAGAVIEVHHQGYEVTIKTGGNTGRIVRRKTP